MIDEREDLAFRIKCQMQLLRPFSLAGRDPEIRVLGSQTDDGRDGAHHLNVAQGTERLQVEAKDVVELGFGHRDGDVVDRHLELLSWCVSCECLFV